MGNIMNNSVLFVMSSIRISDITHSQWSYRFLWMVFKLRPFNVHNGWLKMAGY